jgi:hypothetical protein
MLRARQFTVDARRVVHETIDGETILIDLETGTYFSLRGCGSQIWALMTAGWPETELVAELQRRYPAQAAEVGVAAAEVIDQLAGAGLLQDAAADSDSVNAAVDDVPAASGPYEPPVLERYTDMQYFLLLDPIHEVQEGGWPNTAPTESG